MIIKILTTIGRIILVSLYAMLVMRLITYTMQGIVVFNPPISTELFVLFYLLFFNLNTEGNIYFDRYLNKKLSWYINPRKRIIIQIGFMLIWSLLTIGVPYTYWYYLNGNSLPYPPASIIIFIGSIVLLFGFLMISMAINFFKEWQSSLLEAEHFKQEKLKSDYRVLQNQVNPHFLFNSLNVLISEIKHNPHVAVEFTRKLSKVYRYVLQSKNHDLIDLNKELIFLESYIFLHKVRKGDSIEYSVDVPSAILSKRLPPLTLQILIENVIKHNIANEENVLKISISCKDDSYLIVKNNLQIMANADSTNTGLSNLKKRFDLLNKDGFTYGKKEEEYIVHIPLLEE